MCGLGFKAVLVVLVDIAQRADINGKSEATNYQRKTGCCAATQQNKYP